MAVNFESAVLKGFLNSFVNFHRTAQSEKTFQVDLLWKWYLDGTERFETELYASVDGHKYLWYFFPSKDLSKIVSIWKKVRKKTWKQQKTPNP